ncbi:N-acetyltransferase [Anaerosporobacter sp.]|uniref:N-acetyltransferase n=1 Tax=Anaerosporobacter sp. TaxID=1872529 RepID=UPI00286F80B5|nr:N-acetyltransferase [Anaerosporobacter sp.]
MIRKFEEYDTEQIMQLWLAGNIEIHNFIPKEYWISNYTFVEKELLKADVYVYESDKKIRGFIGMVENYIAGIFVDSNFRSTGVGKSLLEYIKERNSLFTLHVYQQNQRAVEFYLREGFVVVSEGLEKETGKMEYTMEWNKI